VTLLGLLFLKEVVSPTKALGIVLSFLALFCMTYEGLEQK